jgi:hypothetical protein
MTTLEANHVTGWVSTAGNITTGLAYDLSGLEPGYLLR